MKKARREAIWAGWRGVRLSSVMMIRMRRPAPSVVVRLMLIDWSTNQCAQKGTGRPAPGEGGWSVPL